MPDIIFLPERVELGYAPRTTRAARHAKGNERGRTGTPAPENPVMGFYSSEIGYQELDNPSLQFYANLRTSEYLLRNFDQRVHRRA